SATAPVPRQKAAGKEPARRRDPRQPSLFSRVGQERVPRPVIRMGGSVLLSLVVIVGVVILFQLFAGSHVFVVEWVDLGMAGGESGRRPAPRGRRSAGDCQRPADREEGRAESRPG